MRTYCTKPMATCAKKPEQTPIPYGFRPLLVSASPREEPIPHLQPSRTCVYFWNLRLLPDGTGLFLSAFNTTLRIAVSGFAITVGRGAALYPPLGIAPRGLAIAISRYRPLYASLCIAICCLSVAISCLSRLYPSQRIAVSRFPIAVSRMRTLDTPHSIAICGLAIAVCCHRTLNAPLRIAISRFRIGLAYCNNHCYANNHPYDCSHFAAFLVKIVCSFRNRYCCNLTSIL